MKDRLHQHRLLALYLGVMLVFLAACSASSPDTKSDANPTVSNDAPPTDQVRSVHPGTDALPDLELKSLNIADFLASFHDRERPSECAIAPDFEKKIDPALSHFDRVEVILETGKRTELRMQSFGAWAVWKNFDGNYEILTTMITNIGVLMHLHTLNPRFETLGSIEVARRSYIDGDETVKKGTFSEGDNYHYTVVTRHKGALLDSANGHVVVATSGNYKVMDEIR